MLLNITNTNHPDIFRQSFYQYMSDQGNLVCDKKNYIFRIMSFNVYQWMNAIHQPNFDNQVAVIRQLNPDVFILQEAVLDISLSDNDPHIKRFIDLGYIHHLFSNDVLLDPQSNISYGNIIFSKIPFIHQRIINTSIEDNNDKHSCLYVELENNIHLFGTHLDVYDSTDNNRKKQLQMIYQVINTIDSPNIIFMGDLNLLYKPQLTPLQWNYQLSHDRERNIITSSHAYQTIINNHFIDGFDYLKRPPPPISCCYDRRVDYIFIHQNFNHLCKDTQVVNTNVSDHLPIFLDVIL